MQEFIKFVLKILNKESGWISFSDIIKQVSGKVKKENIEIDIEGILATLSTANLINLKHKGDIRHDEFKINGEGKEYLKKIMRKGTETVKALKKDIGIVMTVPLYFPPINIETTIEVFGEIIDNAEQILWIATPYIDKHTISFFSEKLQRFFKREKSDFRLVISCLDKNAAEAIYLLNQLYKKNKGKKSTFEVRVHCSYSLMKIFERKRIFPEVGEIPIREKFSHAKLYLSENRVLITSANLTNYSFNSNAELGVIFREKKDFININKKIFHEIWLKSEEYKIK